MGEQGQGQNRENFKTHIPWSKANDESHLPSKPLIEADGKLFRINGCFFFGGKNIAKKSNCLLPELAVSILPSVDSRLGFFGRREQGDSTNTNPQIAAEHWKSFLENSV